MEDSFYPEMSHEQKVRLSVQVKLRSSKRKVAKRRVGVRKKKDSPFRNVFL